MQPAHPTSRLRRAAQRSRKELLPLLVMLALLTAARSSFANHYQVPSGSMQPTLQPGDRVVVDMHAYGWRLPLSNRIVVGGDRPQRGDVAVFDSPHDGTRLIKRVVAVAGDRVELRNGHLSINGQPLQIDDDGERERFGARIAHLNLDAGGGPDLHDVRVPVGKILAIGDHRGNSQDGRYFGFVDASAVYGKAVAVYTGAAKAWSGSGCSRWRDGARAPRADLRANTRSRCATACVAW